MGLGGGGNNPPSVSEIDERLYRRGVGHRGRLGGQGAWQSEGERSDSEADGRTGAEGGAALDSDELDALVGEAVKSADQTFCSQVAKAANDLDPDRWAPATVTGVNTSSSGWGVGNPFYDALRDGRETFDVPLLSLASYTAAISRQMMSYPTAATIKHWRADFPVLSSVSYGAYAGILSWNSHLQTAEFSCPLLEDGRYMFYLSRNLESVKLYAPMLKNGFALCAYCSGLASFEGDLSSLEDGTALSQGCNALTSFQVDLPNLIKTEHWTFGSCRLDLPSVQRIAHTIKDIRGITTQSFVFGLDGSLKGKIEDELKLIRSKGWSITPWYKT